jgi:glutathione S-transferase
MITIFHIPQFRSLRVVWLMEEIGEDYQLEIVPFPTDDAFKSRSLIGAVPTIVDGEVVMGESIAILQYLTGRRIADPVAARLTVGPSDPARYAEHLQFLHLGEASLMTPMTLLARTRLGAPEAEKANFTAQILAGLIPRRLEAVERRLADGRPHLTGEDFTIADISVGYALAYATFRGLDDLIPPRATAYLERLKARPAWQRAAAR